MIYIATVEGYIKDRCVGKYGASFILTFSLDDAIRKAHSLDLDIEGDRVEIYSVNPENLETKLVWGFWGWHWYKPKGMEQGEFPEGLASPWDDEY